MPPRLRWHRESPMQQPGLRQLLVRPVITGTAEVEIKEGTKAEELHRRQPRHGLRPLKLHARRLPRPRGLRLLKLLEHRRPRLRVHKHHKLRVLRRPRRRKLPA